MDLLINAIVSIILYAVFGAIGISVAKGNKTLKNIDSISSLLPFHTHQIHTAAAGLSNFLTRHRMSDFNYC